MVSIAIFSQWNSFDLYLLKPLYTRTQAAWHNAQTGTDTNRRTDINAFQAMKVYQLGCWLIVLYGVASKALIQFERSLLSLTTKTKIEWTEWMNECLNTCSITIESCTCTTHAWIVSIFDRASCKIVPFPTSISKYLPTAYQWSKQASQIQILVQLLCLVFDSWHKETRGHKAIIHIITNIKVLSKIEWYLAVWSN